ncbi:hypothetical protein [Hyphococcus luteus]|jgi:hypothetical protein|uniref:Lipoprotein n=1 Tax=Hyphococcus luteus TaxID=2058213 RepID=A0A2S7K7V9_9PROT|nr:hypothetical protein [Marinicaulis flavus]PQA88571.1 hypothetical protein CW354_09825 [Marinicaulis flavus]
MKKISLVFAALGVAACATLSPRVRIENRFVELGLSENKAECMAHELDERLDRDNMKAVADFVGELNAAGSAGGVLDAMLGIDNARAAAAIAASGVACAFE